MVNKLFNLQKKHFGIDIGTGNIKIVELESQREKPLLKVLTSALLPQNIYRDGNISNREALGDAIRELVRKSGISTPYCVSAIEGQHIFNRFINFPVMTKREVLEVIKWDAEKYIPYAPGDCYMDAVILHGEPGAREMKVLLVASGKEVIDAHVELLCKADLIPVAIDFGALALGRALLDQSIKHNSIILDIGASSTKIIFFKGQSLTFSRTMSFGGNWITHIIQEQLGVSWEEAESFKIRQKDLLFSRDDETGKGERVRNILTLAVNDLKREIHRSLEYYQIQNQDDGLSQIIFTGGGAMLRGLQEMLLTDLDLSHVSTDLSSRIDCGSVFDKTGLLSASPIFSTALGLALWGEN
jgi:type IV pilus assembly protein PilM